MPSSRKTILCIDDYPNSAAGWCLYLQNAGFSVETAYSAQEGLQLFATTPVDLVLLDYSMPEIDGGEVAAIMKRMKPEVRILMLSGVSDVPEQNRVHVDAFIQKGHEPAVILRKITELLGPSEVA